MSEEKLKPWYFHRPETPIPVDTPHFGFNEPEPELEFEQFTFECISPTLTIGAMKTVLNFLNEGWQIDDKIVCPPYVMIIFSREKETTEDARK